MSQWFLIYLQICAAITTVSFNTFSSTPKKILSSSVITLPSPRLSPEQPQIPMVSTLLSSVGSGSQGPRPTVSFTRSVWGFMMLGQAASTLSLLKVE